MIDSSSRRALAFAAGLAVRCTAWPGSARSADAFVLLQAWSGPHGGLPQLDRVQVADFKPALEAGMVLQRHEIADLAANPAPPVGLRRRDAVSGRVSY